MSLLAIVQPLPIVIAGAYSTAGSGLNNLLSAKPKEAFVASTNEAIITVDLGVPTTVDSFFLGYTTAEEGRPLMIYSGTDLSTQIFAGTFAHSYRRNLLMRHGVAVLDAPVTGRYFRFRTTGATAIKAGVVSVGLSIRPSRGYEWNSGRPISDTGRADRLFDGSFGIQAGARAGGFQWTMFPTDLERELLYALALDVGTTGSVWVVEDSDATNGLNERAHWGLLPKLEPYERQEQNENKWSMLVSDWA